MMGMESHVDTEYIALMQRAQDTERIGHLCWTAGALTAAVTLSWAVSGHNSGLLLPVVMAIAVGFYALLRARRQARSIGGYIETFCEGTGGARWYGCLRRLQRQPGYAAAGDWLSVCLANAGVVLALVLAWMWADASPRGELMAGIVTGISVLFGFHSISETVRMSQTDWPAMWRQTTGDAARASRAA